MKRFFSRTVFLALLQLVFLAQASSQVPAHEPDRSAYITLVQDLFDEVLTMDAVKEPLEERQRFISNLQRLLTDQTAPNPTLARGKSWTGMWPPRPLESSKTAESNSTDVDRFSINHVLVSPAQPNVNSHSLNNLQTYVYQRLGESTAHALKSGQVTAVVYGGKINSALSYLGVPARNAIRIPSFYESWGIVKLFVPSTEFADGNPRVVFVIPPSLQYLQHYATMMKAISVYTDRVVLDVRDQTEYRARLRMSLSQIASKLNVKPDYAVLGYYNQWLSVPSSPESEWMVVEASPEAPGSHGLTGRFLRLKHKTLSSTVTVLLINSSLTMWGQAAAFIAEAALQLNPRGLVFMGSSGALSSSLDIYSLSVPDSFSTKGGTHSVENFARYTSRTNKDKIGSTLVNFGVQHGNTFSPIEQDLGYLLKLRNIGIDTIDVEQSLIAQTVEQHNKGRESKVLFGAINVITDRPSHIFDSENAEHDLDRVDWEMKDRARKAAIQLALRSISAVEQPRLCQAIFTGGH